MTTQLTGNDDNITQMLCLLWAQQVSITNTHTPEEWQTIIDHLTESKTCQKTTGLVWSSPCSPCTTCLISPASANTFLLWLHNQVTYPTDLELWKWLMYNLKGKSTVGETVIKTCKKWVDDMSKDMIQMPAVEGAD